MAVAVALIAAFVMCVTIGLSRGPIKPFVDVTGPEKVVELMIFPLYVQYIVL